MYTLKGGELINWLKDVWSSIKRSSKLLGRAEGSAQILSQNDLYINDRVEPLLPMVPVRANGNFVETGEPRRIAPVIQSGLPEQKQLF